MNSAYGDWWDSWTAPTAILATVGVAASIPVAAISLPFAAGAAGLAITGAAAADAYNWYYAASPTLPTGPVQIAPPASYDLQLQQQAQIEAAMERYKKDPAASPTLPSWFWPVAIIGGGAVVYFATTRRRGRS
jgi:hypothetical protein